MPVTGRGGEYRYFMCRGRQDHACDAPYIRIEDAEAAVLRHYATLRLPDGFADRVRQVLEATLADEDSSARMMHAHLTRTLRDLYAKENNLLDLVEAGGTIAAKVRERLALIGEERARLQTELAAQTLELVAGAALIRAALDLFDNPQELYRQTTDVVPRQLNQVFFGKLYLEIDEITDDCSQSRLTGWCTGATSTAHRSHTCADEPTKRRTAPRGTPPYQLRVPVPPCWNASRVSMVQVRPQWWAILGLNQ